MKDDHDLHDICEETRRRVDRIEQRMMDFDKTVNIELTNIKVQLERIDSRTSLLLWLGGIIGTAVILTLMSALLKGVVV